MPKNKSSQFPKAKANPTKAYNQSKLTSNINASDAINPKTFNTVQPERISLNAHTHIQAYLTSSGKKSLDKEDLNAILRLSQHLRIFGLLSASGYINQSNEQEGKVRERTVPVWKSLLTQLLEIDSDDSHRELMEKVINLSENEPQKYLAYWRKSLLFSKHWNFWAKAYTD